MPLADKTQCADRIPFHHQSHAIRCLVSIGNAGLSGDQSGVHARDFIAHLQLFNAGGDGKILGEAIADIHPAAAQATGVVGDAVDTVNHTGLVLVPVFAAEPPRQIVWLPARSQHRNIHLAVKTDLIQRRGSVAAGCRMCMPPLTGREQCASVRVSIGIAELESPRVADPGEPCGGKIKSGRVRSGIGLVVPQTCAQAETSADVLIHTQTVGEPVVADAGAQGQR